MRMVDTFILVCNNLFNNFLKKKPFFNINLKWFSFIGESEQILRPMGTKLEVISSFTFSMVEKLAGPI